MAVPMDMKVPNVPPPWTITLPTFWTSSPPLDPILSAPKPPNMAPETKQQRMLRKNNTFYSHLSTCPRSCPSWSPSSFCQNTRADPLRNFPAAQASLSENVDSFLKCFRFSLAIYILLTCEAGPTLDSGLLCWLLAWLQLSCGKQQLLGLVWKSSKNVKIGRSFI